MKKRRKKDRFFSQHAWQIAAAVVLAVLSSAAFSYLIYEQKSEAIYKKVSVASEPANSSISAAPSASTLAASFDVTATSTPIFSPLDLSYGAGIYVYSKKEHVCNDYRNIIRPNYFSMRCKVADGIWRGHFVKKIDVAGYNKLRVKASLGVNDYTDYFAECGHKGVNRDDFINLVAFRYDPTFKLDAECNHEVAEEKWSKCQVANSDPGVVAHCGVPMCSNGRSCDFEINVSKRDAIYLVFSVNDVWVADIEGSLSNVEYALIK